MPRLSVVLRKGYGAGYIAMGGGRSFSADLALAWPTAEICAMAVEGAVDVAYRRDIEADRPGLQIAERIEVIAPHPLATLRFDNCVVPEENLIVRRAVAGLLRPG